MKTLLSLFDYSGNWSKPFLDNGWNVIMWDIKHAEFMDLNLVNSAEVALDTFGDINGIIAGVPCTDFAISGARWFAEKDASGSTEKSVQLVHQVMKLVDLYRPTDPDYDDVFFWCVENPVSRIHKLVPELGNAWYFNPFEFAGYLCSIDDEIELDRIRRKNGIDVTSSEAEFILEKNAYSKKTGLWGEFNHNLVKKIVNPVLGNAFGSPHMRLGGKSEKTKEIRSVTPSGFARAFYEANKAHIT